MFSIEEFKTQALEHGGARAALFDVQLKFPSPIPVDLKKTSWTAKSTFLPASITTSMNVSFLGRGFKFAGERTYPQWTCTFINDEDFELRNGLERWADHVSGFEKLGTEKISKRNPAKLDYLSEATVNQYSKNGNLIKSYILYGLFPVTLTDIAVSWDASSAIEEFTCTFDYQYMNTNYRRSTPDTNTITPKSTVIESFQPTNNNSG